MGRVYRDHLFSARRNESSGRFCGVSIARGRGARFTTAASGNLVNCMRAGVARASA